VQIFPSTLYFKNQATNPMACAWYVTGYKSTRRTNAEDASRPRPTAIRKSLMARNLRSARNRRHLATAKTTAARVARKPFDAKEKCRFGSAAKLETYPEAILRMSP
jgi:hypothetical protein